MAYENIRLERAGHVATLTLDRPDARNAMTAAMGDEISRAVNELRDDAGVRVVVITGAGKSFSSGGDLGMLARDAGISDDGGERLGESAHEFYRRFLSIRALPMPTIAALNGHAIGAGLCVAMACDIRIAAVEAKVGVTFSRLGIHPGMGTTYLLPRLVGMARAAELLFSGRLVDAVEAERMGLLNRVVPAEELSSAAAELASAIADAAPIAVRLTKRALAGSAAGSLDDALDLESMFQAATFRTADAREGIRAVMEKRPPHFEGR